jgi:small subunit ribosomal protein S3
MNESWRSRWFTTKPARYINYLKEDVTLRKALMSKLKIAGVVRVDIERSIRSMKVVVYVTRPGVVIGRGGSGLEELKKFIYKTLKISENARSAKIELQVEEIKQPDLSAHLVATKIVEQIEKRIPSRKVVTKAIDRTMDAGAKGIKVLLSGRINGAEIARRELYPKGSVPAATLRADIDYAQMPALTRSGYVGVKVWIYRGEKE